LSPENLQRALDLVAEINPSFESTADEVVLDINAQVCNVNNVYYQCHPLSNCVSYTISYSEREPWRNTKVVVLETASCVKNRVRLRTIHQMVGPLLGPCVCRSFSAPGCPILFPIQVVYLFRMFLVLMFLSLLTE
jgi:hypothetical protein